MIQLWRLVTLLSNDSNVANQLRLILMTNNYMEFEIKMADNLITNNLINNEISNDRNQ